MSKVAWYLGCRREDIGDRVILVGDPARISRLSENLDNVSHLPINRGLNMATGTFRDTPITLAAYGMGAPIAAIVLHELADLGARIFVRIGTSIGLPPVEDGDFVIAEDAYCYEGTSSAYISNNDKISAHTGLVSELATAAYNNNVRCVRGSFASFDGFYKDMFAIDEKTSTRVSANFARLTSLGVAAIDMETSAILTVGRALGCKTASLCVSSVNGVTKRRLPVEQLRIAETHLAATAMEALVATSIDET